MSKTKRWLLLFFALLILLLPCYMAANYMFDPMCYFAVDKGSTWYNSNQYGRAVKSKYSLKHADEIDAVVLGGSKSGALDVYKLSEYTGLHYYNFYMESGNFSDYLTYAKFLVERCGIQEMLFHISSFEVMNYSLDFREADVWRVPAIVEGSALDRALETLRFLMTDTTLLFYAIKDHKSNLRRADNISDGMKNWGISEEKMNADPEAWVEKEFYKEYPIHLKTLFGDKNWKEHPAYQENLEALKQIRALCDEHGVKLTVVIGASSISERFRYEQDPYYRYYDYLRELVRIAGSVWDFSSFNDINMNPYNFYNFTHYSRAVADLQVDMMYGKQETGQYGGFGILLTEENVDEYLRQRKDDYLRLKEEYEATGTVAAGSIDDPSNITVKAA